ncbi:MAG: CPBP family intramembrane glutamic endopeptidase [Haloarculaceae archaeon]
MAVGDPVRVRAYFLLAYGVSWAGWGSLALLGWDPFGFPGVLLFAVGGVGPAVAGVGLVLRAPLAYRREYRRRLIDPSRIGARWLAVVLLLPLAVTLVAFGGLALVGEPSGFEPPSLLGDPGSLLSVLAFTLVFGPLPEELGWRGYVLDGLLSRHGALAASLLLGVAWWLWHLPLFLLPGTYQAGLGVGTPAFWLFGYFLVLYSVLYTWVHANTRRSTLAAVLFHFAINATGELLRTTLATDLVAAVALLVIVAGVVGYWGPDRLARTNRARRA